MAAASALTRAHATPGRAGESDERLSAVAAWRDAPYFTDAERAALALTEAATRLSDRSDPVPDEVWGEAARHYDEPALAALILSIATTNVFNRLNVTTRQVAGAWAWNGVLAGTWHGPQRSHPNHSYMTRPLRVMYGVSGRPRRSRTGSRSSSGPGRIAGRTARSPMRDARLSTAGAQAHEDQGGAPGSQAVGRAAGEKEDQRHLQAGDPPARARGSASCAALPDRCPAIARRLSPSSAGRSRTRNHASL